MFEVCCRLCLEQVHLNKIQSLYTPYEEFTIRDKVYELFQIKLSDTEKLSTVCEECMEKIKTVDNIRKFFLESDRKFQRFLNDNLQEEEVCKPEPDENYFNIQENACSESTIQHIGSVLLNSNSKSNTDIEHSVIDLGENISRIYDFEQPLEDPNIQILTNGKEPDVLIESLENALSDSEVSVYDEELISEQSTTHEKANLIDDFDYADHLIYTSDQSCEEDSKLDESMDDADIYTKTVETDGPQHSLAGVSEDEQIKIVSGEHQCNVCNEALNNRIDLIRHINDVHFNEYPHPCKHCLQIFKTINELKMHDCVQKPRIFRCSVCPESFQTVKDLSNHTRSLHGSNDNQKDISRKIDLYKCDLCTEVFRNNKELIEHGHSTHPKDFILQQCDRCEKAFGNIRILQAHFVAHDRKYECSYCGKVCPNNVSLAGHENTHTKDQPFQCTECGRNFAQYTSMRRHMKIHYNVKSYECEFCPKRFRQRSVMLTHKRIHTGEKPFSCDVCSRTFRDHSTLAKHKRIHDKKIGKERQKKIL